jgi:hypothetical protein
MTFVPWSGLLGGAVAMGGPVAVAMGSILMGLLAATTFALVLGAERRPGGEIPLSRCNPRQTTVPRPREANPYQQGPLHRAPTVKSSKSKPTSAYCVIPFLLPLPKNPCPARAQKASQAGRRRFDPARLRQPDDVRSDRDSTAMDRRRGARVMLTPLTRRSVYDQQEAETEGGEQA